MRSIVFALVVMSMVAESPAATFVYVSRAQENLISIFRMNETDGTLEKAGEVEVAAGPGSLTLSPDKKYLFASLRTSSALASFHVDPQSGALKQISSTPLAEGANAAFVATDRTGRYLLAASYSGGRVTVHSIDAEGRLGEKPLQTVETTKTAHSCYLDAANRMLLVPHVAPNAVYQFRFDAGTGKLTELSRAPGGKEGAGPRHLAFHPSQKFAFTSDEKGSSVTLYQFQAESGLKPVQTLSTLPADFAERNTTADVKTHPSGKFVWVSNRGHDSLAGFAFDESSGKLASIGQTPTEKTPRSFDLELSGRFLYAGGEGSGKLAAYRVDPNTGKLERFQTYDVGKLIAWVMAVSF